MKIREFYIEIYFAEVEDGEIENGEESKEELTHTLSYLNKAKVHQIALVPNMNTGEFGIGKFEFLTLFKALTKNTPLCKNIELFGSDK